MIDIDSLPQEVQDIIELREQSDGTFHRFVDFDYTDIFFNKLAERADPTVEHSMILTITGLQGGGKSMSAISIAKVLNPAFDEEFIYFNYNKLVRDRVKLKPNSVVLVDEQSQSYGLDSHRIMIILASLKEQLRKKSIHFIFCAPVLYSESQSSMYILEMIFIDYEEQEAYGALKTREGLTLGHVRIPYPLKDLGEGKTLASPQLIKKYQDKKDAHLEELLGRGQGDEFEERADAVINHTLFRKAEKIYVKRMGYMPQTTMVQIINKIFPEYNHGVVPNEIAGRIKLKKELSGKWEISGRSKKKAKKK